MTQTQLLRKAEELCRKKYETIRSSNAEPIGDHWECVGAYLGDDEWADPEEYGLEGEWLAFALANLARDPGWRDSELNGG